MPVSPTIFATSSGRATKPRLAAWAPWRSSSGVCRSSHLSGPRTHPAHPTEEAAGEESDLLDLPVNPDEGLDQIPDDELNPQVPS